MRIVFRADSWRDYLPWQAEDAKTAARINTLITEASRHPFAGSGKPEPLKRDLSGWWSRRITGEHRAQALEVLSCRYHY